MLQIAFNKLFSLDPEKMKMIIKMIFLHIKANSEPSWAPKLSEIEKSIIETCKH